MVHIMLNMCYLFICIYIYVYIYIYICKSPHVTYSVLFHITNQVSLCNIFIIVAKFNTDISVRIRCRTVFIKYNLPTQFCLPNHAATDDDSCKPKP